MTLKNLGAEQRNAFLDILVLGMYADGHLAGVEDQQVQKVLDAMGWTDAVDHEREFDASVTRVRKYSDSPASVAQHAKTLAGVFRDKGERQEALNALENLLRSDNKTPAGEMNFLEVARNAFR
jgi:hypothetical protein